MKKHIKKYFFSMAIAFVMPIMLSFNAYAEGQIYYQGSYDDALYRNGGYDATFDPDYDCIELGDQQEVKWILKENFTFATQNDDLYYKEAKGLPSAWDSRLIGGEVKGPYYHGNYQIIDTSEYYPVQLIRNFEKVKHGVITLESQLYFTDGMNDSGLYIYGGNAIALNFITKDNKLYLKQNDSDMIYLFDYEPGVFFGLRAEIDIDNKIISEVYKSGQCVAKNIPFAENVNYIDRLVASTGDSSKGTLGFNAIYMYRGFRSNETFVGTMTGVPQSFKTGGNISMKKVESSTKPDVYSMVVDGTENQAFSQRDFDFIDGLFTAEMFVYADEGNDGIKISLLNDENNVFDIKVEDGYIYYDCEGKRERVYEYIHKLWNKFSFTIDTNSNTVNLYVNYKLLKADIPFTATGADSIRIDVDGSRVWIDDIVVKTIEMPEDYVPVPQKVDSKNVHISMQFCPMWEEGSHMGWDWENNFQLNKPYIGFYDQSSPEAMDWTIKHLAEHGVDFMNVIWCGQPTEDPVKTAFIGGTFTEAYFNSRYKEYMPISIMWENVAMDGDATRFTENLAPYWIEYYFKNENYYKIDGRPVFCIYTPSTFISKTEKLGGSKQDCIDAIAKFRKMCVEAGVGNPIILSGQSDSAVFLKELGLDGARPYWYSSRTDADENAKSLGEMYKGTGIKAVPSIGHGIADHGKMFVISPEDLKEKLWNIKNSFFDNYDSFNMINLETWDEYSEGHWFAPATMYGFGHLDAVREVFCGGDSSDHIDTVPTMHQKDRFNNLYPYGRKLEPFEFKTKGTGSKENITLKQAWNFDKAGDLEGWSGANIGSLTTKNGMLSALSTSDDPQILIRGLGLDVSDVTYLKIKYHVKNPSPVSLQVFYALEGESLSETNSVKATNYGHEDGVVWIFVGGLSNFNGVLDTLRIDPGSKPNMEFSFDYIELYSDASVITQNVDDGKGFSVIVDSVEKKCDADYIIENDTHIYPLRNIAELMNSVVDYDFQKNVVNVIYNNNRFRYDIATNNITLNDKPIKGENNVVVKDGTTYVTDRVLATIFGVSVEWDEEQNSLIILSEEGMELLNAMKKAELPREILASYEFETDGDNKGWSADGNNMSSFGASGGTLKGTVSKAVIMYTPNNLEIPCTAIKRIKFSVINPTKSDTVNLYYITDQDTTWNEAKKINVKIAKNSKELTTYYADVAEKFGARFDELKQIRFSLNNVQQGDKVEIGRFEIEGDIIEEEVTTPLWITEGSHVVCDDSRISWDFDTNGPDGGWILSRSFANINLNNSFLNADIIGKTPVLQAAGLNINADTIHKIRIKYKNNTSSEEAKLYFMKSGEEKWSEESCFTFDIYPYDLAGNIYEIKTEDIPTWNGNICGFRFEPTYSKGNVSIDYIRLEIK